MFTLYKSSAGSGKTFTLVKEYLRLCLTQPEKFPRVLAITFTNKAAAEMKSRIIGSLHEFLSKGQNPIIDVVIDETGMSHDQAVENARRLQTSILHAYSDFSVMTIDSFISRIVRTFARDLDMPLKFDVELDTDYITTEVIEKLMAAAEPGQFLGDVLIEFALSKIYTTGSWYVDGELASLGRVTFNEKFIEEVHYIGQPQFDAVFWRQLIQDVENQIQQFRNKVNHRAKEALAIIERHDLVIEDFAYGKSGPAGALVKYAHASNLSDFTISKRMENREWISKSKGAELMDRIEVALADGVERLSNEILDLLRKDLSGFVSHIMVQKNIYAEALIHQFITLADIFKDETNSVPLTDFSRKVSDVIVNEPVPFLYWRLGNQYSHILIDEFQDTSILQWTNLLPLIEESLARGEFNMAVGDGKQAIYRWRAGDVRIMEQQLPQVLGAHVEPKTLDTNYRSRKEIIEFNNAFFEFVSQMEEFQGDLFKQLYAGQGASQKVKSKESGYVQIQSLDLEGVTKKKKRQSKLLEVMVKDVKNIIDENNDYSCQDLAVLVRNNHEAQIAAEVLFEAGFDIISPDSLRLKSSAVVRFVINALRYAVFEDTIALLSMWLHLGKDVHAFQQHRGERRILETELSPDFRKRKRFIVQLPVYEAVEEIIEIFELNRKHYGFLQGLLEVILNYADKFSSEISGFLTWWEGHADSDQATLPASGCANAITLSTIHKAKGLEFPIVMLPFAWDVIEKPKDDFLWVQSDLIGSSGQPFYYMAAMQNSLEDSWFNDAYQSEQVMNSLDHVNLLYVALTRAVDRLYLYIPQESTQKEDKLDTADLIRMCLPQMPMEAVDGLWTLGQPSTKIQRNAPSASEKMTELPSYSWRNKITVKQRAAELWRLEDSVRTEKVEYGQLVHDILEQVKSREDIQPVLDECIRQGLISIEKSGHILQSIENVMDLLLDAGTVADWFQSDLVIKNEKAIAFEGHEYRPDRVILKDEQTIVVDYKTGPENSAYHNQLLSYGQLLKQMGYPNIHLYLLYLELERVEEVPWNF